MEIRRIGQIRQANAEPGRRKPAIGYRGMNSERQLEKSNERGAALYAAKTSEGRSRAKRWEGMTIIRVKERCV